jgi:hypothetical protein
VPFVVARAGGSTHLPIFRGCEGLRGNVERPGTVQKSTFSDDRQHSSSSTGMSCSLQLACVLLLAALTRGPLTCGQDASQGHILTLKAGKESVVRFFYQPPKGHYFHDPLIFRVVEENDPRWNTTAYSDVGLTAYVSLSDMQQLFTNLAHLSLRWDESAKVEGLETYKTIQMYGYGMAIKVLSAEGTAKATIEHDKICETLARLDGALLTPRALWEFRGFRWDYHCCVPELRPRFILCP